MLLFRVATALGYPHPDFMMLGMNTRQLMELMEYYQTEPFGEFRHELRHGQQMALHANINRDTKQRNKPFSASDFMNFVDHLQHKQEPAETDADYYARVDREVFGII